ncbi:MAG: hypothetical protein RIS25_1357 [Actinomycetota bacterium]|jgi:hypothetical protein
MIPPLFDCDLEQLRLRMIELDDAARAVELGLPEADDIVARTFALGGTAEDGWNDYHLVRNEYDRRAAEEFDLGQ